LKERKIVKAKKVHKKPERQIRLEEFNKSMERRAQQWENVTTRPTMEMSHPMQMEGATPGKQPMLFNI